MLVDCFTHPLLKPTFLKYYAAMGTIGIGLGNHLRMGINKGPSYRHRNRMETAKGIQNSNARKIYWAHFFLEDPHCAIRSTSILYTVMVEKDVTSVLEEYSDDWEY